MYIYINIYINKWSCIYPLHVLIISLHMMYPLCRLFSILVNFVMCIGLFVYSEYKTKQNKLSLPWILGWCLPFLMYLSLALLLTSGEYASVLIITEAKKPAKIWIKKKIFITYGLSPNWLEAESCVQGTGFKTTEA